MWEFLAVDNRNGGGNKHRASFSNINAFYKQVL